MESFDELTPAGTLRVGVVEAPYAGLFFVAVESAGPRGVTVDLGTALASTIGRDVVFRVFPNSGECTSALAEGALAEVAVDVAFMPVDAERQARVAFGPGYYRLRSTCIVTAGSGVTSLAELDQPQVRVVGIANTTTIRATGRMLRRTVPVAVRSVEEGIAALREGRADALALSYDSLLPVLALLPGSRILEGAIQETDIAIAVPPGRAGALAAVTAFMVAAKRDGTVQRAFAAVGLPDEVVAT